MKKSNLHILLAKDIAYNEPLKDKFHKEGKRVLKAIAKELNFDKKDYSIRSNKGGIAVSGEITLHHEKVYIQIYQSSFLYGNILYRKCNGQRDFTGEQNRYYPVELLQDIKEFSDIIGGLI